MNLALHHAQNGGGGVALLGDGSEQLRHFTIAPLHPPSMWLERLILRPFRALSGWWVPTVEPWASMRPQAPSSGQTIRPDQAGVLDTEHFHDWDRHDRPRMRTKLWQSSSVRRRIRWLRLLQMSKPQAEGA
jgi:hypothetical protein